MSIRLHATSVLLGDAAVLLTGPPGAGKSDLALRLIDRGALLVADDQVEVEARESGLFATAPLALRGLLEVRGLGIVRLPFATGARVLLLADLARAPDRMPAPDHQLIAGVRLPRIALAPFDVSAPLKLERAVALARASALWSADDGG
jgi:HPr kinase/phosphorylase